MLAWGLERGRIRKWYGDSLRLHHQVTLSLQKIAKNVPQNPKLASLKQ